MMVVVSKIAAQEGLDDGYRVVINNGENGGREDEVIGWVFNGLIGQAVWHLHIHILGCKGTKFTWPPGTSNPNATESQ